MGDTYCVCQPVQFQDSYEIGDLDPPAKMGLLGLPAELSRDSQYHGLTVGGIASEEAAREILRQLHVDYAGLVSNSRLASCLPQSHKRSHIRMIPKVLGII